MGRYGSVTWCTTVVLQVACESVEMDKLRLLACCEGRCSRVLKKKNIKKTFENFSVLLLAVSGVGGVQLDVRAPAASAVTSGSGQVRATPALIV